MSFNKKLTIIILAGFLMHFFYGIGLWFSGNSLYSINGDAPSYIQTAQNFLEQGVWSADADLAKKPDNFRTPIFPLILLLFLKFKLSFIFLILIQSCLMIATSILVYVWGRKIFKEQVAFSVAFFLSIDPYLSSTFVAKSVMTEPIALFLVVIVFLSIGIFLKTKGDRYLLISILALAIGALLKPQILFFIVFFILAVILAKQWRNKLVWICLIIYFFILSPWLYYNFFVLKVIQFSSVSPVTLFVTSHKFQDWQKDWQDPLYHGTYRVRCEQILGVDNPMKCFEPHNAEILAGIGKEIILDNPFSFALFHISRIPKVFYHDTTIDTFYNDFGIFSGINGGNDVDVIKNIIKLKFNNAFLAIINKPIWIISLSLKFMWFILSLLALANFFIVLKFKKEISKLSLILILFMLMYGAMISPHGIHRYKVLVEPFILFLAFDSIRILYQKFYQK